VLVTGLEKNVIAGSWLIALGVNIDRKTIANVIANVVIDTEACR